MLREAVICSCAVIATLIVTFMLMQNYSVAQDNMSKGTRSKLIKTRSEMSRGIETPVDISKVSKMNDPTRKVSVPPQKSRNKSRTGDSYTTDIDNSTQWNIDIYGMEDSVWTYEGTVPGYGDLIIQTGTGCMSFYGQANFPDSSHKYWGAFPDLRICADTWRLDP